MTACRACCSSWALTGSCPGLQGLVGLPGVVGAVAQRFLDPSPLSGLLHQAGEGFDVVGVVGGDRHRHDLLGPGVDGEVELHVPLPLAVLPLHPASGLMHLDACRVDGYGDWFLFLLQRFVWVGVQSQDTPPEPRVVAGRKLGDEPVEAAGEALQLAVGQAVEVPDGGEEPL